MTTKELNEETYTGKDDIQLTNPQDKVNAK